MALKIGRSVRPGMQKYSRMLNNGYRFISVPAGMEIDRMVGHQVGFYGILKDWWKSTQSRELWWSKLFMVKTIIFWPERLKRASSPQRPKGLDCFARPGSCLSSPEGCRATAAAKWSQYLRISASVTRMRPLSFDIRIQNKGKYIISCSHTTSYSLY